VVDPSPTTGVFGGKALIAESSHVELSSSSEEEVDFGDEPALPDPSKFSHISEEEIYSRDLVTVSPTATTAAAAGTLVLLTRLLL